MAINSVAIGVSALLQNGIRAIILLVSANPEDMLGVYIYYMIAMVILLLAASMYFVEQKNQFAQYYLRKIEQPLQNVNRFKQLWKQSK